MNYTSTLKKEKKKYFRNKHQRRQTLIHDSRGTKKSQQSKNTREFPCPDRDDHIPQRRLAAMVKFSTAALSHQTHFYALLWLNTQKHPVARKTESRKGEKPETVTICRLFQKRTMKVIYRQLLKFIREFDELQNINST